MADAQATIRLGKPKSSMHAKRQRHFNAASVPPPAKRAQYFD